MESIEVKTSSRKYQILVGKGTRSRLTKLLKPYAREGRKLFVVFDAQVYALHGKAVLSSIKIPAIDIVVPAGEKAKTARQLAALYDFLLSEKISRGDLIVACGGGATTDLAGFAAATVLRGVRWAAVPTTLLGMVDAAIGGKTGINHAAGKNLIGAFWQPEFVLSDTDFLHTLDPREVRSGFGEVVKCAALSGGQLNTLLAKQMISDDWLSPLGLECLIAGAAGYKARVVSADERESGRRVVLNFGHTFGHGIERALRYRRVRHGEAVVLGIAAALAVGESLGFRSRGLKEYGDLVDRYLKQLPRYRIDVDAVIDAMALDKKRARGKLRFVLLERIGKPILRDNVSRKLIRGALEGVLDRQSR